MKPNYFSETKGYERKATSLRRSLFLRFTLLVTVAVVLFALGYAQFGFRPVVARIAESHFNAAVEKVNSSLDQLFGPVETWIGVARQWVVSMPFNEANPEEFNRLFSPVLRQTAHMTSIVAGSSDGRGWLLLQKSDGVWMNRFTNIPERGNLQRFIDWADDGSRKERLERLDYDPRERPWYKGAIKALALGETLFWTDPYIFFTTGDPGITASTAIAMPEVGVVLALGIDIKLVDISRMTEKITVGSRGYVSVMTADGRLLGLPRQLTASNEGYIREMSLKPMAALDNPVMNDGATLWQREGRPNGGVLSYAVKGEIWLASFREFRLGEQAFWVSVFAPESDFVPAWQPMAKALLGIFAAALILSFLLALRYTRRFSEPLEMLARSSARIAQLDFHDGQPVRTDIAEIRQLASAQTKMRHMLSEYRRTVDSQAKDLKQQIAALRGAEARLEHLSQHDPLTGLPNRMLLNDRLSTSVPRAERRGTQLAVLFLDLDRFKEVNDSQGHPVGDQLLCVVATRLAMGLRKSDTLARLGGDEFVLLAEDIGGASDAENLARKLLKEIAAPFEVENRVFHLTGSVGISMFPADGNEPVALIRNADSAMYQAKAQGRNTFRFYSEEMTLRAVARLQMEESLHRAIERKEFELHYQPQVNMRDGQLIGAEALVRWRHPEKGLVAPYEFIPLAEETGLIGQIGEWVLEESCRQWAAWAQQGYVLPRISVNWSVKQLQYGNLLEVVTGILEKTGVPSNVLELEVTESFFLESPEALNMLLSVGKTGVSFALDDFGTGYSSLGYLKTLPLARLKIDRGFTWDIGKNADGEAVARAIIGLAGALGRDVLAEGVETPAQVDFLLAHGCEHAQGFHFSKPLPAAAFIEWCSARGI
ncbi:MAG: EAL domain-containing protein [Gammaproteobacteria bacterium]|nr:EAL domain-containing protein [Rhodocyclaceae bacterium]MBU3909330.1 EAL domain-containing protein [Gammaproteobacteria bacterium]MBU3988722.1 EAL domain-containing protein [Gammaproteobacteria bacterium]MBU4005510.1 EAL domain-containing protein [Gammaproteobacteria bacterium]MBU4020937.1 EAL domain-containing protein [Gammaproteobacteria bacterium]